MYDTKCQDLAEAFLEDEKELTDEQRKKAVAELAQHIQDEIEGFLEFDLPKIRSAR